MLSSITSLLIEGSWSCLLIDIPSLINILAEKGSGQIIATTLITFKQNDGIKAVTEILETFWNEVQDLPSLSEAEQMGKDGHQRMAHAYGGIKIILSLFTHLVSNKTVLESSQTQALQTRDRPPEANRPDLWNAFQFLVELRASILPVVRSMWDSGSIEKASGSIVKSVIEILGIVLKAECEGGAFTKKDVEKRGRLSNTISWRTMEPDGDRIRQLVDMGFTRDSAVSALQRCNGNVISATELLTSQGTHTPQRGSQISTSSSRPHTAESQSSDDEEGTDVDLAREETGSEVPVPVPVPEGEPSAEPVMPPPPPPAPADGDAPGHDSVMAMSFDDLVAPHVAPPPPTVEPAPTTSVIAEALSTTVDKGKGKEGETPEMATVTVEDLEAIRSTIRENLINRSLDVLQVHPNVTFELSALIASGFGKVTESVEVRKEVASTILQSLMSLQMDDLRPQGKTIASTAHLLGLVLQNQEFFDACLEDLKDNILTLVGFIKIYPGESAPWVANILLVVEKVLSESAQPRRVHFSPPGDAETENTAELDPYKISDEDQSSLFEAVMAIIPEISKDEVLPLAVVRILVLLTRRRDLAIRMIENGHLQRLFHMFRRQSGLSTERIQSSLMVILRHIIEDVDILKSIMKAEIRTWFNSRGSRQSDTQSFIRHNHHLVLRDPEVFVEVVNELCKLTRYDPHLRNQQIAIKDSWRLNPPPPVAEPAKPVEEGGSKEGESEETEDKEMVDKPRPAVEMKPPGLEKPDGVIHFLLSELLACKDVEDSVPAVLMPVKEEVTAAQMDVQMDNTEQAPAPVEDPQANLPSEPKKPEKPEFKAEQHPTFIYRCFILQALTELLSCYNRSKIEFINFSRKAAPRDVIAPSKPRSATLNYLLSDIIPLGTLLHTEDIAYKKRATTSQWAILAIVSLSAQTGEITNTEDEPNLLFVRKFILESALKAFKDASFSMEPLDTRYSRMMSLTDLFFRMLSARPNHNHSPGASASEKSSQQIARIMFEKNFIAALTSSLADIDLNFPSARRVIKYILRPLKLLSKTATELSETSSISSLGATDEDEISTASSVSDIDDMREEAPDLYRNSTLGMFEGSEMVDDDQSSYDEDEEDDEMYDEEMEMEEDMEDEGASEVSDEDEDHQEDMDVSVHDNRNGVQMIDVIQVEIVVQEEHHDSEDEDDDELSDDMDEGEEVEIIDEMAEDHQGHYGSGGEDDWQSEGSEDDEGEDEEIITDNPLETIVRALGGAEEVPGPGDEDRDDGFIDDEVEEEDEDEDDEDMDEEEAMIQEDYEDDEGAFSAVPWGWAEEAGEAPMMARAHPRGHGGWYTLGGPPRDPLAFSKPISNLRDPLGNLR